MPVWGGVGGVEEVWRQPGSKVVSYTIYSWKKGGCFVVLYSLIFHLNSCFCPVLKGACVVAQHGGSQGSSPQLKQVGVRVGRVGVEGGGGGGGQRSPISSPPHHSQGLRRHVGRATQPALQDRGVETSNQALNIGMWSPEFWSLGTLWGQRGKATGHLAQEGEEQRPET